MPFAWDVKARILQHRPDKCTMTLQKRQVVEHRQFITNHTVCGMMKTVRTIMLPADRRVLATFFIILREP